MLKIKSFQKIIIILFGLLLSGCVEPIDIDTTVIEDALVIDATITNEYKYQKIRLTRSFKFSDDQPIIEKNADIRITDDLNTIYKFHEDSSGNYVSDTEFMAISGRKYLLNITTSNGKTYSSQISELPNITNIDNLTVEKKIDNFGNKSVAILVDSYDATAKSTYYRYEYEETYKIIAPKWTFLDMAIADPPSYQISFVPKSKEEKICYKTDYSNSIIQTETNDLTEDRVSKFKIKSLNVDDPIISHRYSILVKQYVQSLASYTYYKTLNKQSSNDNIFSSNQPGFIRGNVFSIDDPDELVIGYFDISSVSAKRVFFNFSDIFPDENRPPYFTECLLFAPSATSIPGETSSLVDLINSGDVKYYQKNPKYPDPLDLNAGPYLVVNAECGDCTKIGSNIKPEFWED